VLGRPFLLAGAVLFLAACSVSSQPSSGASPGPGTIRTGAPGSDPTGAAVDSVAGRIVRDINTGDGRALVALYSVGMSKAFPIGKTGPFVERVLSSGGPLGAPTRTNDLGERLHGTYRVKAERADWLLEVHIDEAGAVTGLRITSADLPPPVERSSTPMSLPIRGKWFVSWGGDTPELNQHISAHSQRRAADLVVKGEDGKTFRGDGLKNEDFFAYGKEVLAAADGDVDTVVDGVPENTPGMTGSSFIPGNVVVVRHSPTLYSVYAHLQPRSVRVKVGTAVHRGDLLGLCGNSGHSSEPHLHFQLQDGPHFDSSWGVEAVFEGVVVTRDGTTKRWNSYAPLKGDFVESAP
jgi:murein DD-endopeptidase MepM/ murein hydrolase activator NlpD